MKRFVPVSFFVLVLIVVVGCGKPDQPTPEETTLTAVGQVAPTFEVTTLEGQRFDLAEARGKVVLVNFWATWCPPCREEIPHLEKLWQRIKGEDFIMVALARGESEEEIRPFVEANDMTFPVAADSDKSVYALYAEQYIPRSIVVDRSGAIVFQSSSYDQAEFEHMVEAINVAMGFR